MEKGILGDYAQHRAEASPPPAVLERQTRKPADTAAVRLPRLGWIFVLMIVLLLWPARSLSDALLGEREVGLPAGAKTSSHQKHEFPGSRFHSGPPPPG